MEDLVYSDDTGIIILDQRRPFDDQTVMRLPLMGLEFSRM